MYYDSYEDFMRNSGYGYNNDNYSMNYNNTYQMYNHNYPDINYETMYPEIYKKINPIVEIQCIRYQNKRVSKEVIDEIAENVYRQYSETRSIEEQKSESSINKISSNSSNVKKEEYRSSSQRSNILMDLIKILVIKNLIQNCSNKNCRPPIRPDYGIPPYPNWDNRPQGPGHNIPPQYGPRYY